MSIAEKLEAALAEEQAKHQWQPIETAPKLVDVLTITSDGQCRVLYLTNNGEGLSDNWRWPRLGTAAEVWPSHWQPLPQPPVTKFYAGRDEQPGVDVVMEVLE